MKAEEKKMYINSIFSPFYVSEEGMLKKDKALSFLSILIDTGSEIVGADFLSENGGFLKWLYTIESGKYSIDNISQIVDYIDMGQFDYISLNYNIYDDSEKEEKEYYIRNLFGGKNPIEIKNSKEIKRFIDLCIINKIKIIKINEKTVNKYIDIDLIKSINEMINTNDISIKSIIYSY